MFRSICFTLVSILFLTLPSSADAPNSKPGESGKEIKQRIKEAEDDIKRLIKQLDDDEFDKREKATRELTEIGAAALPLLRDSLKDSESTESRIRIVDLIKKLTQKTKVPDLFETKVHIASDDGKLFADPKTTVKEALDWIATKHGFIYEVNEQAFELVGGKAEDRLNLPLLGESNGFPMDDARLGEFIQRVLRRLGGEEGSAATLLVRRDHLEITTWQERSGEAYQGIKLGKEENPLVTLSFAKCPLDEALDQLAERGDLNIILDVGKLNDARKAPITARFLNTPVDTAIRLTANMADLKVYIIDNIIYVTTPERVKALEEEEEQLIKKGRLKYPRGGAKPEGEGSGSN